MEILAAKGSSFSCLVSYRGFLGRGIVVTGFNAKSWSQVKSLAERAAPLLGVGSGTQRCAVNRCAPGCWSPKIKMAGK